MHFSSNTSYILESYDFNFDFFKLQVLSPEAMLFLGSKHLLLG